VELFPSVFQNDPLQTVILSITKLKIRLSILSFPSGASGDKQMLGGLINRLILRLCPKKLFLKFIPGSGRSPRGWHGKGCFRFGCLEKLFGYTYIYSFLYYFPLWLIIGH